MDHGAEQLSQRERLILQAVVHAYITTAEPVGSRAIVRRFDLDVSPATVRNVMADLEEAGYLKQLHTSSGRVPTDKGYRYYVDFLMSVQELTRAERARIQEELSGRLNDADEVIRHTSRLLALTSHHMGLVEVPDERNAEICRIEMVPIGTRRVGVVLVDNYGRVRTLVAKLDEALPAEGVQRIGRFLDANFRGVSMQGLQAAVSARTASFLDEQRRLAEQALRVLALMPPSRQGEVILEGTAQLFEQPEFQNVDRARQVFGFFEEHDRLVELIRSSIQEGEPLRTSIVIGSEVPDDELHEISIVVSPYCVGEQAAGVVGVIGPRRMQYSRLAGLVEYTAALLGSYLTGIAGMTSEDDGGFTPLLSGPRDGNDE